MWNGYKRMVKLISHRCNLNGIQKHEENHPGCADDAIAKGFDVELDVRYINDKLYLGHDAPQYEIDDDWIQDRIEKLWLHCKNLGAIDKLHSLGDTNYFWHQKDDFTLTSKKYIWTYPNRPVVRNSVLVHPEETGIDFTNIAGICSDYIERYV